MSFLKRQNRLLSALKDSDYALFDGDRDEALDTISSALESFPDYANIVIKEQIMLPIWRERYEGTEYREKVQEIDSNRRSCHDSAIASISMLNRISEMLHIEPFAAVDTNDRHAVADVVGRYVNELYNNGIGNTFDDATYNKTGEYDRRRVSERVNNAISELNSSGSSGVSEHELH